MASNRPDAISPRTEIEKPEVNHPGPRDVSAVPGSDVQNGKHLQVEGIDAQGRSQRGLWKENSGLSRLRQKWSDAQYEPAGESTEIETRPVPHHYMVQRPRALQFTYKHRRVDFGEEGGLTPQLSNANDVKYTMEGVAKARERIDLFIDLVWVGIISNLSEVFTQIYFEPGDNSGTAFLTFNLIFLPSWRIWNLLREFLNNYYMDDTLQRVFIGWILTLSVIFGNNIAYYPDKPERAKITLITVYLIARGSFLIQEIVYSFWIPWLRKLLVFNFFITLPSVGLWIASIYVEGGTLVATTLIAMILEYAVPFVSDSPLGDKLIPGNYRKEIDPSHLRSRMGGFFIITVGEGVLMLIRGGPLGVGVNSPFGLAVWSLILYYILTYVYFVRDNSVKYTPAVRHRGWRLIIWTSWHIPIFAAFISLSAGILFFINREANIPLASEAAQLSEDEFNALKPSGIWCISISISIILLSCTMLALLDRPHDPPKTHLINNRFIRLSGRAIYILIILTIPIKEDIDIYLYMGIVSLGLSFVLLYETAASLERPAGVFEPKGLAVLMQDASRSRSRHHDQENETETKAA